MRRLVIHIGLRKAGSTTIQQFLDANTKPLQDLGCDYPREGRRSRWSHLNIAADIRQTEQYDAAFGGVDRLRSYLEGQNFPLTIISSEVFEPAPRKNVEHLRDVLNPGFDEVMILLVIRDPSGLIPSSYAESICTGRKTMNFDGVFERLIAMRRLNYFLTARKWAMVWGWKSLRVQLLDRAHMLNGDLVDDFLNAAGLDVSDPRFRALKRPDSANVSPGWKVIEALRALYGGDHNLPSDHALISKQRTLDDIRNIRNRASEVGAKMGWNAERGNYLTRSQAERCEKVFVETIKELNSRLSVPVPMPSPLDVTGFKERRFMPAADQIGSAELREFYDQLGERFLAAQPKIAAPQPV